MKIKNPGINKIVAWSPLIFFFIVCALSGGIYKQIVNPPLDKGDSLSLEISEKDGRIEAVHSSKKRQVHLPVLYSSIYKQGDETTYGEFKYRLLWSVSAIFFFFTFMCVLAVMVQILYNLHLERRHFIITIGFVLMIGLGLYFAGQLPFADDNYFNEIIFHPLSVLFPDYDVYVGAVEGLGFITLLILAMTTSLILFGTIRQETGEAEQQVGRMIKMQRSLRMLLYFGVFALVAGTIEVSALYTWAMQLVSTGTISPPFLNTMDPINYFNSTAEVVRGFSLANGVFYTMLLAAIFTPFFMIMNKYAQDLVEKQNPTKSFQEKKKWLKEHDLTTGVTQQVLQIVLALAPALVGGPLIGLLEAIG